MLLETLRVKTEAEEVCVKEEPVEECANEVMGAHIKEEECEDNAGLCYLYAGHQVKDELVLGPVELHRPCVSSALPVTLIRASFARGRACSVRLKRLLVDVERRSCQAGPQTYTLPSDCTDAASNVYQCHHCGKGLPNKAVLGKHLQNHLRGPVAGQGGASGGAGRACSVRLERLPVDAERRSCRAGPRTDTRRRAREPGAGTDAAGERCQCHHCGGGFSNKDALRKHVHPHFSKPSTYSENNLKTRSQKLHVAALVTCGQCTYATQYKNNLRRHEMSHTGEKPFKCSHC